MIIGQLVHYMARGSADGIYPSVCRAAKVTEIASDDTVSLAVFNPTGLFFDQFKEYDSEMGPGTWHTVEDCLPDDEEEEIDT